MDSMGLSKTPHVIPSCSEAPLGESELKSSRSRRLRGWVGVLRTVLGFVLALAGAAAVVVGVTLQWLQDSLVDRDGFAQISQELVHDESLQQELTDTAVTQASDAVQGQDLGAVPFSGALKDMADRRIAGYIREYVDSDQYVDDWNDVLLTTHQINIEPAGSLPETSGDGAPEDLELYVAPVVGSLESHIEDRLQDTLGVRLNLDLRDQEGLGGQDGIIVVRDSATGPAFDTIADSTVQAPLLLWGGVAALVLAALLSRHREWVLVGAGVGAATAAVLAQRGAQELTSTVLASPDLQDVGRSLVERVFQILLTGMDHTLAPWLWGGVAVAVVGALLAAARLLWRSGSRDSWETGHTLTQDQRRRRVVEI